MPLTSVLLSSNGVVSFVQVRLALRSFASDQILQRTMERLPCQTLATNELPELMNRRDVGCVFGVFRQP